MDESQSGEPAQHERWFRAIFAHAPIGIQINDMEGRFVAVNPAAAHILGYEPEEMVGMHWTEVTHPDDMAAEDSLDEALVAGEIPHYELDTRQIDRHGQVVWTHIRVVEVFEPDGEPQFAITMVEDITERRQAEEALQHRALHDALTDLPNRVLLLDRMEQRIAQTRRTAGPCAMLLMDLNLFKEVNDTYGHQYGDTLLQELAQRLHAIVRESDTVARLGGDEFALVLPDTDRDGAIETCERIDRILAQPFQVHERALTVGASIGVVLCPEHGEDVHLLLRRADIAMYAAKRAHHPYAVFESHLESDGTFGRGCA